MDYILRLQIGGDRLLKSEEIQIFVDTSILFKQFCAEYEKLMLDHKKRTIVSQNGKIHKVHQAITNIFSRKLLK
jgi:hypothetical protein